MNGSMLSHPPTLMPRIGIVPYANLLFSAGTCGLAWAESSHVELSPMTGSPPTVAAVYVTFKSTVSYQLNGSRYDPFADAGMLLCEMPFRLPLAGWPFELLPPLLLLPLPEPCFFFESTTATGMTTASIATSTARYIPSSYN